MTEAQIIGAIRDWFDLYGEPPLRKSWDTNYIWTSEGKASIHRTRWVDSGGVNGRLPTSHEVARVFGTFTDGLIAAGFYPRVTTKKWAALAYEDRCPYLRNAIQALRLLQARAKRTKATEVKAREKVAA